MDSASRSYYEILGVGPSATLEDLRTAHRHLAFLLHPDRQAGFTESEKHLAERRIREVNEAWTVLSDPERRAEYDRVLESSAVHDAVDAAASGVPSESRRESRYFDSDSAEASYHYERRFTHDDGSAVEGVHYDSVGRDDAIAGSQPPFMRRGVVIAVLAVALVILIFTAYAGSVRDNATVPSPPTSARTSECAKRSAAEAAAVRVPCSDPNDGRIVAEPTMAAECPSGTEALFIDSKVVCVEPVAPTRVLGTDVVNGD